MRIPVPTPSLARPLGALCLLALAAGCTGGDASDPEVPAIELPAGVSPVAADARLVLPPSDDPGCQPGSMRKVFREESDWEGFWTYGLKEGCPRPALPVGFDFGQESVAMVSMGTRESMADSIRVVGVGAVGDSLLVVVDRVVRDDSCPEEAGVRTWPRDLVRFPADTRPVRFVERRRRVPCPPPADG